MEYKQYNHYLVKTPKQLLKNYHLLTMQQVYCKVVIQHDNQKALYFFRLVRIK